MVNANRGLSDPPNGYTDNNVTTPNNDIVPPPAADSDSDEETNNYEGYQPLPGNAEDACSEEESDEDDGVTTNNVQQQSPPAKDLPDIVPIERTLLKEVWESGLSKDIEMDSSKVDAVKRAMVNITLPASAFPDWANNVPEEEWKATLLNRIQDYNKK